MAFSTNFVSLLGQIPSKCSGLLSLSDRLGTGILLGLPWGPFFLALLGGSFPILRSFLRTGWTSHCPVLEGRLLISRALSLWSILPYSSLRKSTLLASSGFQLHSLAEGKIQTAYVPLPALWPGESPEALSWEVTGLVPPGTAVLVAWCLVPWKFLLNLSIFSKEESKCNMW